MATMTLGLAGNDARGPRHARQGKVSLVSSRFGANLEGSRGVLENFSPLARGSSGDTDREFRREGRRKIDPPFCHHVTEPTHDHTLVCGDIVVGSLCRDVDRGRVCWRLAGRGIRAPCSSHMPGQAKFLRGLRPSTLHIALLRDDRGEGRCGEIQTRNPGRLMPEWCAARTRPDEVL